MPGKSWVKNKMILMEVAGGGWFGTLRKFVELIGLLEAVKDFGDGFRDGYNSNIEDCC